MRSKAAGERSSPIARDERLRPPTPFRSRVAPRGAGAPEGPVDPDADGRRAARAAARPGDSRSRCRDRRSARRRSGRGTRSRAVSTTVSVSGRGTRVSAERAKGQSPELPLADDPGDRLMGETPPGPAARLVPPRRSGGRTGAMARAAGAIPRTASNSSRASSGGVVEPASVSARRCAGPRRGSAKLFRRFEHVAIAVRTATGAHAA